MGERSEEPDSLPGKVPRLLINTLSLTVFSLQAAEDNQQPGQPLLELSQFECKSMQWWAQQKKKKDPAQIWPRLSVKVAAFQSRVSVWMQI